MYSLVSFFWHDEFVICCSLQFAITLGHGQISSVQVMSSFEYLVWSGSIGSPPPQCREVEVKGNVTLNVTMLRSRAETKNWSVKEAGEGKENKGRTAEADQEEEPWDTLGEKGYRTNEDDAWAKASPPSPPRMVPRITVNT